MMISWVAIRLGLQVGDCDYDYPLSFVRADQAATSLCFLRVLGKHAEFLGNFTMTHDEKCFGHYQWTAFYYHTRSNISAASPKQVECFDMSVFCANWIMGRDWMLL